MKQRLTSKLNCYWNYALLICWVHGACWKTKCSNISCCFLIMSCPIYQRISWTLLLLVMTSLKGTAEDTTSDCRLSRLSCYVFPSKMLPYQLAQIQTLVLFISRCTLVLPWSTMNNRRHWQMFTGHGIDDNREFAQWWRSAFNLLDHLAGRKNYSKLKLEFKAVYSGSVWI